VVGNEVQSKFNQQKTSLPVAYCQSLGEVIFCHDTMRRLTITDHGY